MRVDQAIGGAASSLTDGSIPLTVLHAEIARRKAQGERPECGSGASPRNYNTTLHVAALVLILVLSTLACSFPIIVRRFPQLPIPNYALFVSRHFGTGVLIATAFVHLLPTAYTSLTDPCLPPFWNQTYPAMSGFIAMISVLTVVGIEMFFAVKGASHSHGIDLGMLRGSVEDGQVDDRIGAESENAPRRNNGDRDGRGYSSVSRGERESWTGHGNGSLHGYDKPLPRPPSGDDDSDLDLEELDPVPSGSAISRGNSQAHTKPLMHRRQRSRQINLHASSGDHSQIEFGEQRAILQCLLLEAGILFHSVFIGMALSVSTGPAFIVLLIAISFHQTFEGLALGSRIAAINGFSTSSLQPWLMSCMYGVTTPIGQAIGLAVHTLYDPASQFGLLMVGIVNAISSGLLLYAGLVQLLAEDFLSDQSYQDLRGRQRIEACAAVVCGCLLMAFVGVFA